MSGSYFLVPTSFHVLTLTSSQDEHEPLTHGRPALTNENKKKKKSNVPSATPKTKGSRTRRTTQTTSPDVCLARNYCPVPSARAPANCDSCTTWPPTAQLAREYKSCCLSYLYGVAAWARDGLGEKTRIRKQDKTKPSLKSQMCLVGIGRGAPQWADSLSQYWMKNLRAR